MVEEGVELDLAVAQHVRIRRAAAFVFPQEVGEHPRAIFGGEIDGLDVDADDVGHGRGIDEVLPRRTVSIGVVVFPVLHEHADDLVSLTLEQPSGN